MFRQISGYYNGLVKIKGKCGKGSPDIQGLFLKQLPLGQCLKRCEHFVESERWWLEKKVVYSI